MNYIIMLILGIEPVVPEPDASYATDAASRHIEYRSRIEAQREPTIGTSSTIRWIRSMTMSEASDPHPFKV